MTFCFMLKFLSISEAGFTPVVGKIKFMGTAVLGALYWTNLQNVQLKNEKRRKPSWITLHFRM